jgi:hypothetical protein
METSNIERCIKWMHNGYYYTRDKENHETIAQTAAIELGTLLGRLSAKENEIAELKDMLLNTKSLLDTAGGVREQICDILNASMK